VKAEAAPLQLNTFDVIHSEIDAVYVRLDPYGERHAEIRMCGRFGDLATRRCLHIMAEPSTPQALLIIRRNRLVGGLIHP
jgi:hypothetical protein